MDTPLTERPPSGVGAGAAQATGTAAGGWVFRHRSWLPVPLALLLTLCTIGELYSPWVVGAGVFLVTLGQAIRLWAVRHIGVVSRTRTTRLGPALVTAGPYAHVRNPLYVANFLLWTGFVLWSTLLWVLPIAWAVFALQYGAIARWEEALLQQSYPEEFADYARKVRRWMPTFAADATAPPGPLHPWPRVFFSERGTLIAVAVMGTLLTVKALLT